MYVRGYFILILCFSFSSNHVFLDSEWKLVLIRQQVPVGVLPGGQQVFCITRILILSLSLEEPHDLDIEVCFYMACHDINYAIGLY